MKHLFEIQFGGFYNTIHDEIVEMQVGRTPETSYEDTRKAYCQGYIDLLNEELGTSIEFIELDSPKEYNFTTDVILAECKDEDIFKIETVLKNHQLWDEFIELVLYRTTSRDGYIALKTFDEVMNGDDKYHYLSSMITVFINKYGETMNIQDIFA